MKGTLKVDAKNPEETVRSLFAKWLRENRLSAILTPAYSASGTATPIAASQSALLRSSVWQWP